MTSVGEFFTPNEVIPERDALREELIAMIRERNGATPRHLQKELGPSEVAHPCMRRMAFGMMEVPRCNPQYDPLPSIVGTATHTWLQTAAEHANAELYKEFTRKCELLYPDPETRMFAMEAFQRRWLTETKVNVAPGLSGSCDLYDTDTDTVIDWKVLGDSSFKRNHAHMSPTYQLQTQFYGLGFENAGLPVKQIAVAILPRGGTLSRLHLWRADYDRDIALRGLAKRDTVIAMLNDFQVETKPEHYQWIPIEPYDCIFCPWFKPEPKSPIQCGGKA